MPGRPRTVTFRMPGPLPTASSMYFSVLTGRGTPWFPRSSVISILHLAPIPWRGEREYANYGGTTSRLHGKGLLGYPPRYLDVLARIGRSSPIGGGGR